MKPEDLTDDMVREAEGRLLEDADFWTRNIGGLPEATVEYYESKSRTLFRYAAIARGYLERGKEIERMRASNEDLLGEISDLRAQVDDLRADREEVQRGE